MAAPKKVDYEAIEPGWRAGILSPEQLAADYTAATGVKVSRVSIIKHFEKRNIPRDLAAKIKAKADAMVAAAMVTGKTTVEAMAKESAIVEAGAMAAATVQINQRSDIRRARAVNMALLVQLEAQIANIPELEHLGQIMRSPNENGQDKLNDIYRAVIALPELNKTMKAWTESFKMLAILEREAFGIVAEPPKPPDDSKVDREDLARSIIFMLSQRLTPSRIP